MALSGDKNFLPSSLGTRLGNAALASAPREQRVGRGVWGGIKLSATLHAQFRFRGVPDILVPRKAISGVSVPDFPSTNRKVEDRSTDGAS